MIFDNDDDDDAPHATPKSSQKVSARACLDMCLCCKHQLHGAVQHETIATQIQFIMNLIVMILFECISKKKS